MSNDTTNVFQFPGGARLSAPLSATPPPPPGPGYELARQLKPSTATRKRRAAPRSDDSRVHTGEVVGAVAHGRIEHGQREIFERVTCVRASSSCPDLAQARGELVIESFGGRDENVIFTPDDGDLSDAEIFPKSLVRDGSTIEVTSKNSRWVFVVEV